MPFIVDLFYLLAAPFFLVYILFRSRFFTRKRYRAGLAQKFGGVEARDGDRPCLWIHAVSVGEVRTSLPLIVAISRELPDWEIALSTSTDTGYEVAEKSLAASDCDVRLFYYPLDASWAVRRVFNAIRPGAVVLIELELWPNFLMAARAADIPVFVVNGRLTERSARRYAKIPFFGRFLFSLPNTFAVQDEAYAKRFREMGVPADRLEVLGNLKYDIGLPGADFERLIQETRSILHWPSERGDVSGEDTQLVLMGGCTHPGEEKVLLEGFADILSVHPASRLILAPRHIERSGEVLELANAARLGVVSRWSEWSEKASDQSDLRVLVVDVIGELDRFYELADLVFVGGSLVKHGGHNILEPARFGKPVIFGPWVDNFSQMVEHFLARKSVIQVESPEDFRKELKRLVSDSEARRVLADRAQDAASELSGAVCRHVAWLSSGLDLISKVTDDRGDRGPQAVV